CLYGSMHIYGAVEDRLYRLARGIVEAFLPDETPGAPATIDAVAFTELAQREFSYYRSQDDRFDAQLAVRDDINNLTVSDGKLFVPSRLALTEARARALLAHEIGTHMLTFHNGKVQPLTLLSTGLAGSEQ